MTEKKKKTMVIIPFLTAALLGSLTGAQEFGKLIIADPTFEGETAEIGGSGEAPGEEMIGSWETHQCPQPAAKCAWGK